MKICHCGGKLRLDAAIKVPAPPKWQAREAWQCADCQGISHAVQEPQPVVRGPKDATALLNAHHDGKGRAILTWATRSGERKKTVSTYPWPRRISMSETDSLIHLQWKHLMSKVEIILPGHASHRKDGLTDDQIRNLIQQSRYEARGIAEVLAIQMKPFMEDADAVVRHAVARFKNPDYEVPGLGEHLWDPMRDENGNLRVLAGVPATTSKPRSAPKPAVAPDIADSTKQAIIEACSSGIFTPEVVAGMYNLTASQVKAIIA